MSTNKGIVGFDFHCHVDLHADPVAVIEQCERDRIAVVAVTTTPKAWAQNHSWMKASPYVHAAVGLHPELVGKRHAEIVMLEQLIGDCRLVGEVGLDGSPQHSASYEMQKKAFSRVLEASQRNGGRVLTIHSRRAARDVIAMIEERSDPAKVLCILHWFSGSLSEARRAADAGCFFSVNSAMLKHDRGRALVQSIPKDRILTETDAPFAKIGSRNSEPRDVVHTITELAELYGESATQTMTRLTNNSQCVLLFAGIDLNKIASN